MTKRARTKSSSSETSQPAAPTPELVTRVLDDSASDVDEPGDQDADGDDESEGLESDEGQLLELDSVESEADEPKLMQSWLVEVKCPTPLARNPVQVAAFDADGAWAVFCAMNGISDTEHPKTIDLVV